MDYDNPDQAIEDWKAKREAELAVVEPTGSDAVAVNAYGQQIDARTGQFVKGHKGGPGRKKGSKFALAETFIADLHSFWQERGMQVIEDAAKSKPADLIKAVASILPKDVKVTLETMDDGELSHRLDELTRKLDIRLLPAGPVTDIEDPP